MFLDNSVIAMLLVFLFWMLSASVNAAAISQQETKYPLAKRVELPDNMDIYIPDGKGNLVEGVETSSPDGTPAPYDVVFTADGSCDGRTSQSGTISGFNSAKFCNQNTMVVYGAAVKITPDIDCTGLASCSETRTTAITTSSSFNINFGVDGGGDVGLAGKALKLTAKLAAGKTWTDTTAQTDSFTFTPKPGSKGHMLFYPYVQNACGFMLQTQTIVTVIGKSTTVVRGYDPASCGTSPLTLSNGQADGVGQFLS